MKTSFSLSPAEHDLLHSITKKGTHKARVITRAHILLKLNKKVHIDAIAREQDTSTRTVKRMLNRWSAGGLDFALYDRPRPGQPPKLDTKAEAYLIATACSDAPEGSDHWTLELLRKKMIKDKKVKDISTVALWHRLNKQDIKPWREKNVVYS